MAITAAMAVAIIMGICGSRPQRITPTKIQINRIAIINSDLPNDSFASIILPQ
jgi:hypothetical protein